MNRVFDKNILQVAGKLSRRLMPVAFGALMVFGCIEPYTLEGVESDPDFVVVDGFMNASDGTATVKISRAIPLESDEAYPAITNATVTVESDAGDEFLLPMLDPVDDPSVGPGTYQATALPVDLNKKYRLNIAISNGSAGQYQSDWIALQKAAPIESVQYRADQEDVKILVSTTESPGVSNYYRWRYQEAFEYNSPWFSAWYMNTDREMVYRSAAEHVYICYREDPSYEILVGSSRNLSSNVIQNFQIKSIPRNSIRISRMYTINVQQMGLTEEAYTYWLNLYKTTESTGGLFDPLPGQIFGNIHSVSDPNERVIGYFSGSTVEERRIFFTRNDLPHQYVNYRPPFCDFDTIPVADLQFTDPGQTFGVGILDDMGLNIIAYTVSSPTCLDCRVYQKGTTTKPAYWP